MAPRSIVSLAIYQMLASNRIGVLAVFFPLFLVVDRGASVEVALIFSSAAFLGSSLVGPLAGRWSDRVGRRKPFLVGAELAALPCLIAVPLLPDAVESGLAFISGLVILGIASPALNAYIADINQTRERGASYGTLNAASGAGAIAGFLAVGVLITGFGLDYLFYFAAGVMACVVVFAVIALPDVAAMRSARPNSYPRLGPLVFFSTAVSIRTLGLGAVGAFYALWTVSLGGSAFDVSLVAISGLAVIAVVGLYAGRFVDRRGEYTALLLGTLIQLASWTAFLLATHWYVLPGAQALGQFGYVLLSPAMLVWVSRIAPPGRQAEYQGIFALINSGFWSLGPTAGAVAFDLGGGHAVFLFAILAGLVSLVLITAFQSHYRGKFEAASGAIDVPPRPELAGLVSPPP